LNLILGDILKRSPLTKLNNFWKNVWILFGMTLSVSWTKLYFFILFYITYHNWNSLPSCPYSPTMASPDLGYWNRKSRHLAPWTALPSLHPLTHQVVRHLEARPKLLYLMYPHLLKLFTLRSQLVDFSEYFWYVKSVPSLSQFEVVQQSALHSSRVPVSLDSLYSAVLLC